MPQANLETFNLDGMDPAQLEQRRSDIVLKYRGKAIKEMERNDLRELAAITSTLRRKTAGAPKAKSAKSKSKVKATLDDILNI